MVQIDPETLERFAREALVSVGAPAGTAEQVGESLVLSNLRGHHSHGVRRIPQYAGMVEAGRIDPGADPAIEREGGPTATVDGRSAFGQVVGRRATAVLGEKAAEHGVAVVGVRDATHMGRIGEWAERATGAGLVFLAFVNGQSGGSVAPPGSTDGRLFTNPVTVGVPTFDALEFPLVLDMATSQVANGKIKERRASDTALPEGWAVAPDGRPQTDAGALLDGEGALLPLGGAVSGYKGFGLALVAELLAATVSDGVVATQTDSPYSNAGAFVAVDPTAFTTRERVADRVTAIREHVASAEPHPDLSPGAGANGDTVLLPGEAEYESTLAGRDDGIEIDDDDHRLLREFADERGVDPP